MKTFVIIPAAGRGVRSGSATPKQYLKIRGKELIVYTLGVFQKNKSVDEIYISADPNYFNLLKKLKQKYRLSKIKGIVEGGKERQDSVFNALCAIPAGSNDLIAVHDAARPLLPENILTNAINYAKKNGSALVCIKARDTLVRTLHNKKGNETVSSYINRDEIFYVQTPQIFKYQTLRKAMELAHKTNFRGTDESMLVKNAGGKVNIVEGSPVNFKVTTKDDLGLVKKLLRK
jgi:2-C-methyl-D-erythritol 4-phosphate cytidylyltransferase